MSQDGTLVYAPLDPAKRSLVVVDQTGRVEAIDAESDGYTSVALSPDGRRAVVARDGTLFVHDFARGGQVPLTPEHDLPLDRCGVRTGLGIIYASNHGGTWSLYAKSASGAGEVETVLEGGSTSFRRESPRTARWCTRRVMIGTSVDIWLLPPGEHRNPGLLPLLRKETRSRRRPAGHGVRHRCLRAV